MFYNFFSTFSIAFLAIYLTTPISTLAVSETPRSLHYRDLPANLTTQEFSFNFTNPTDYSSLDYVLTTIFSIPDNILLAGDNATAKYLKPLLPSNPVTRGEDPTTDPANLGFWETLKCAAAIVAFLGMNLVSAAKLLRIKRYIEALGGARAAAELLLKASTWEERLRIGGGALVGLAAEFFGVSLITNNCT